MTHAALEVRLVTASDIALLERVAPDVFDNAVQVELAAQYLANPSNLLAVAVHDGLVVGMASGIAYVHPDKPLQLFINEVSVSESYQNQGIGKRLMQVLLERGHIVGCTEAWVATEENNVAARALYTAMHGTEDAEHAVVYTWRLSSATDRSAKP